MNDALPAPIPSGFKRALLREAYDLTKGRYGRLVWFLTVATLPEAVSFCFSVAAAIFAYLTQGEVNAATPFGHVSDGVSLLMTLVSIALFPGFYRAILLLLRGEEPATRELFSQFRKFWDYLFGAVLFFLGVGVAMIFLIVPGVYLALRWSLYPFAILDEGVGPVAALRRSGELMRGAKWQLFFLYLILGALNVLGAMALIVGLLFTIPMSYVAFVLFYEKLRLRQAPEGTSTKDASPIAPLSQ
ncbi:MAG TPA: DUF975 family protein [Candidatus Methylacidiphilales bacterium]